MNNRRILSLALSIALCVATVAALMVLAGEPARAQATTRYVATTGTDFGTCTYPNNPCRTVQYAVDAADDEDLIKVATGVYTDVQGRQAPPWYPYPPPSGTITQVVYISKTVTVRGGYTAPGFTDPPDPEANPTTLDAQKQGRVLLIAGDPSAGSGQAISPTTEGLRITGGDAAGLSDGVGSYEFGGGVYVIFAAPTLRSNQVFSNTAYDGGGLYLWDSDGATVSGNIVTGNTAGRRGGGLHLWDSDDATLERNTVTANTAYGIQYGGGGLCLQGGSPTLIENSVISNTADGSGGGLFLEGGNATLVGNTVTDNTADGSGGGLSLGGGNATLSGNTITGNVSEGSGGGLYVVWAQATLIGNTVTGNTANTGLSGGGGGLYVYQGRATLTGNTIISNAANEGGGLWLMGGDATLSNNIVSDNQANSAGSGLYLYGLPLRVLHTTIARNSGGDGSGVHVAGGTVTLTNTILVSHTVGITVTAGNTASLESTLWHDNTTDWGGAGTINHSNDYTGDPAFVDPDAGDYHIGPGSAALDVGVDAGVRWDIDPQPRPYLAPDLGADEYWPLGELTYVYLPLILSNAP